MFNNKMFKDENDLYNQRVKREGYPAMPSYGSKLIDNMGGIGGGTTVRPPSYLRQADNGIASSQATPQATQTNNSPNEVNEIKDRMSMNSQEWFDATPERQKELAQENQNLGAKLRGMGVNAVYDDNKGWSYDPVPQQAQAQQKANPYTSTTSADNIAVRKTLNSFGITDDRIGWIENPNGGGTVTVDGQPILTTNDLRDGTSFASTSNISSGTVSALGTNGAVAARDYLQSSGAPFDIKFQDGMLDVGGVLLKPTAVINGKAYVSKADMDRAINQAKKNAGIKSNQSIVDQQNYKYNDYYDKLISNIADRKKFSYDPNNDPVYQSYKQMYTREGNRATQDTMGNMAGLTGGFMNSAAMTAGAQANNYYMQKLNDVVPQLFDSAYTRYVGDFNMDNQALDSVMGLDNMQFNRLYGANRDTIGDINYSNEKNYQASRDAASDAKYQSEADYRKNRDAVSDSQWKQQFDTQNSQFDKNIELQKDQWGVDKKMKEQAYLNQEKLNAQNDAERQGYYTKEQAALLGVAEDADPRQYDKKTLEMQVNADKERTNYQTEKQKELDENQYALRQKYGGSSGGSGGSSRSSGGSKSSGSGGSSSGDYGYSDSGDSSSNNSYKEESVIGSNSTIGRIASEQGMSVEQFISSDPKTAADLIYTSGYQAGMTDAEIKALLKKYGLA